VRNARKCRGAFGSAWAVDLSKIFAAASVIFFVPGLYFFGPCIAGASEASPSTPAPSGNGILWTGLLVLLTCALGLWTLTLLRQAGARRRASAILRESKERLELALSAAEMGTWSWTAATNTVIRDAVLNRILGLDPVVSTGPVEDSRKMV
jgi:PAS domain S-box-containing protein